MNNEPQTPLTVAPAEVSSTTAPAAASPMPPPLPPPLPPMLPGQPEQNLFARHWRGEFSLLRSFWVNHLLFAIAAILAIGEIETAIFFSVRQPVVLLTFHVLSVSAGILFAIWATVGVWRAAMAYAGRRFWADAAKLTMMLTTLYAVYSVLFVAIPQGFGYYHWIVSVASAR